jgi:rhodanese-related sulfurtransferase
MRFQVVALWIALFLPLGAAGQEEVVQAMEEYFDFADVGGGGISPAQIASVGQGSFAFIDTRSRGRFEAGHVPGALHLEWRRVLAERERVPRDRAVVLYCDTGVLSAQARLALSLAGYDNVKVLAGGYQAWAEHRAAAAP